MLKKIFNIDNVMLIVFSLLVLSSVLFIGMNRADNIGVLEIAICLISMVYLLIKKIQKQDVKIIRNKLDVFVLILCLSPVIPLIFGTYISLSQSLVVLFKYIAIFNVYLLAREINFNSINAEKWITNAMIFAGIILCFFGFDNFMSNKFTTMFYEFWKYIIADDTTAALQRMLSILGNANCFGIYIASVFMLAMHKYLNSDKFSKYILLGIMFIFAFCILMSFSIGTFLTLGFVILLYLIMLGSKEKRIKAIETLVIVAGFVVVYMKLFYALISVNAYLSVILVLIVLIVITNVAILIIEKFNKYVFNLSKKKVIFTILGIIMALVVFVIVGLQLTKPLVIFEKDKEYDMYRYFIYDTKNLKECKFIFDIDAKTIGDSVNNYVISVQQKNKYADIIDEQTISFGDFKGIKEMNIDIKEGMQALRVQFISKKADKQDGFIVNKMLLNDKEYALDYLYLPTNLVYKIKGIIDTRGNIYQVNERLAMMGDGIKLIKDNFAFGIGGNGWMHKYHEVQDSYYVSTETHNYYVQVFLEFGIVGFLALLGILFSTFSYAYKNRKDGINKLYIFLALLAILLHSCIDFGMSYFCILMLVFIYLGIISKNMGNEFGLKVINIFLIALLVLFNIYMCICLVIGFVVNKDNVSVDIKEPYISLMSYSDKFYTKYLVSLSNKIYRDNDIEKVNTFKLFNEYYIKYKNNEKYFKMNSNNNKILIRYSFELLDENSRISNMKYVYELIKKDITTRNVYKASKVAIYYELTEIINILKKYEEKMSNAEKAIYLDYYNLFNDNYQLYLSDLDKKEYRLSESLKIKIEDIIYKYKMSIDY